MVVDVTTSPSFSVSKPRLLYEGPSGVPSSDGQHFLAIQSVEPEQSATQLHVLLNWLDELKRRSAPGN